MNFGDEGYGVRLVVDGDLDHFLCGADFQVHLGRDRAAQKLDIAILDVLLVFAQVHGDAFCSGEFGEYGSRDGIRFANFAGFADGGDMVNIKSKFYGHAGLLVISS